MSPSPIPLYAFPVYGSTDMRRLVVTAADRARVDDLLWSDLFPGAADMAPDEVVRFDGQSVTVLDLATREKVALRRASCGLNMCGCALQWFAPGSTPPEPDVYWDPDEG